MAISLLSLNTRPRYCGVRKFRCDTPRKGCSPRDLAGQLRPATGEPSRGAADPKRRTDTPDRFALPEKTADDPATLATHLFRGCCIDIGHERVCAPLHIFAT